MSAGGWAMAAVLVGMLVLLGFLIFSTIRSIQVERTAGRSVWREFGLGLALMLLFFGTWIGQGVAEWQTYTDEAVAHGEPTSVGDFVVVEVADEAELVEEGALGVAEAAG